MMLEWFDCHGAGARDRGTRIIRLRRILLLVVGLVAARPAWAGDPAPTAIPAEPLARRIDAVVDAAQLVPAAPPATDAEFIRRVSLDLIGRIPSPGETRSFLADPSPTKRAALVDALLARPEYVRHLAQVLDVMLMERRADKCVPSPEWQAYLRASVQANKPFDKLVREILSAESEQNPDPATRPAAKFLLDRDGEPNLLTRDVGRIFFGKDFQCNQCHDHPLVGDYAQADYFGLFAFFQRTSLFTDKEKKIWLAEKADGDPTYQSVFVPGDTPHAAAPILPEGSVLAEPSFKKGEEYLVAPAENVRHVPKHSRRALLAATATDGTNPAFARNIANRLWAHMLGRGLVEPVDMHHGDNPPTNPELLELLSHEIVALRFDMKEFLRQIALSSTYQRSIDLPSDLRDRTTDVVGRLAQLDMVFSAAQAALGAARAEAQQADTALETSRAATEPLIAEQAKAQAAFVAAHGAHDTAAAAATAAQNDATSKQDVASTLAAAATAAKTAAEKVAGDQELAQAAEKFRAKSEQTAAEASAAAATLAQRQAELAAAAQALPPAQAAFDAAAAAAAPAREQRTAAEAAQAKAETSLRQRRLAAQTAQARLENARALIALRDAASREETSRAAAEKAVADVATAIAPLNQEINEVAATKTQLEATLAAADQAVTSVNSALTTSDAELASKKQTHESIAEAVAKANAALERVPGDAELTQALAILRTRAEKSISDIAATEQFKAKSQEQLAVAQQQAATSRNTLEASRGEIAALEAQRASLQAPADAATAAARSDRQALREAETHVVKHSESRLTIASMKQLSPEALAWSMMQATGVLEATRAVVEAEWLTAHPGSDVAKLDAAQSAARAIEIEQALYEKLKGVPAQFVSLFASPPGQPQNTFQATVEQALFLANNGTLKSWLAPSGENLTARLDGLAEAGQVAEELYLSVLNRAPSVEESAEVVALLAARPAEKQQIVIELAWALICSSEFRFNH